MPNRLARKNSLYLLQHTLLPSVVRAYNRWTIWQEKAAKSSLEK